VGEALGKRNARFRVSKLRAKARGSRAIGAWMPGPSIRPTFQASLFDTARRKC
jgi:hypothetical protein